VITQKVKEDMKLAAADQRHLDTKKTSITDIDAKVENEQ
jgi:hypothetical protein